MLRSFLSWLRGLLSHRVRKYFFTPEEIEPYRERAGPETFATPIPPEETPQVVLDYEVDLGTWVDFTRPTASKLLLRAYREVEADRRVSLHFDKNGVGVMTPGAVDGADITIYPDHFPLSARLNREVRVGRLPELTPTTRHY